MNAIKEETKENRRKWKKVTKLGKTKKRKWVTAQKTQC